MTLILFMSIEWTTVTSEHRISMRQSDNQKIKIQVLL